MEHTSNAVAGAGDESGPMARRIDESVSQCRSEGSELSMGLFGNGDFVSGRPTAMSQVEVVAHGAADVSVRRWSDVATPLEFAHRTQRLQSHPATRYSVHSHPLVEPRYPEHIEPPGGAFRTARRGGLERDRRAHHAPAPCGRGVRQSAHRVHGDAHAVEDDVIKFQGASEHRRIHLNTDRSRKVTTL